jgi:hypothetical protein
MFSQMGAAQRRILVAVVLATLAVLTTAAVWPERGEEPAAVPVAAAPRGTPTPVPTPSTTADPTVETTAPAPAQLPGGVSTIFGDDRFLVAYYGTAGTGSLGVLGETSPEKAFARLQKAAAPFARKNSQVQGVFELIVTVADAHPGKDGDYNHDISKALVQQYIDAAHEHDVLLLLDVQPGRASFEDVARRWGWALKDPYVGLALDPEWRMGRHGVPGQRIGSDGAAEVNRTSAWLSTLIERNDLPQKLFVLHQFRTDMIRDITRIKPRRGLVAVQHVDGFGTPGQKLDTYRAVAKPRQFRMGFKLFYDEDVHRMNAAEVRRVRPKVRFVSFQ